jgi:hypothetical protein
VVASSCNGNAHGSAGCLEKRQQLCHGPWGVAPLQLGTVANLRWRFRSRLLRILCVVVALNGSQMQSKLPFPSKISIWILCSPGLGILLILARNLIRNPLVKIRTTNLTAAMIPWNWMRISSLNPGWMAVISDFLVVYSPVLGLYYISRECIFLSNIHRCFRPIHRR